jgi:hypothetical protein
VKIHKRALNSFSEKTVLFVTNLYKRSQFLFCKLMNDLPRAQKKVFISFKLKLFSGDKNKVNRMELRWKHLKEIGWNPGIKFTFNWQVSRNSLQPGEQLNFFPGWRISREMRNRWISAISREGGIKLNLSDFNQRHLSASWFDLFKVLHILT